MASLVRTINIITEMTAKVFYSPDTLRAIMTEVVPVFVEVVLCAVSFISAWVYTFRNSAPFANIAISYLALILAWVVKHSTKVVTLLVVVLVVLVGGVVLIVIVVHIVVVVVVHHVVFHVLPA